ncbi:hypothetical protein CYMTET_56129 [Cymbomonas tetramitiformis]|uniref:Uncharacterized protein n=1 Tax=Cymbomonas tetramitiformis TaxID=36881 RepID=A0AAE0EP25_9CHLO|nr:hypothetical protein CYMTET_56129 [Cymbomonas tetramitiformis]
MEAVKLFAAFFFLASLIPATSAATDEYIREAVTRAFSSFPSRSPEEEVHPSDLRAFLSHLRDQENQHVLSTSHAQTVHVNRMLHTIQAEHVLAEKEMFSLESLQAALLSQTDAFGRHLVSRSKILPPSIAHPPIPDMLTPSKIKLGGNMPCLV